MMRLSLTPRLWRSVTSVAPSVFQARARWPLLSHTVKFSTTTGATEEKKDEVGVLNDWRIAAPVGFTLAIPALANQWYVITEETFLLGVFLVYVGLMWKYAGGAIHDSIRGEVEEIAKEHFEADERQLAAVKDLISQEEKIVDVCKHFHELIIGYDEYIQRFEVVKTVESQHERRAAFIRRLNDRIVLEKQIAGNVFEKTLVKADELVQLKLKEKAVQQHLVDEAVRQVEAAAVGTPFKRSTRISEIYSLSFNEAKLSVLKDYSSDPETLDIISRYLPKFK